jgi:hypothetical protein
VTTFHTHGSVLRERAHAKSTRRAQDGRRGEGFGVPRVSARARTHVCVAAPRRGGSSARGGALAGHEREEPARVGHRGAQEEAEELLRGEQVRGAWHVRRNGRHRSRHRVLAARRHGAARRAHVRPRVCCALPRWL